MHAVPHILPCCTGISLRLPGPGRNIPSIWAASPWPPAAAPTFTLTDLRSQSDYQADVFFGHQCVGSCVFRTTPVKNRLDVTEAPFWAKGDGKTKNTAALQRAIDACGAGDTVYIPAGIYLTGALRLHSNMELYLDEGAILQGTAEIVDYQPRIPSRFEGTEMRCYSSLLNLGTLDHAAGPNCEKRGHPRQGAPLPAAAANWLRRLSPTSRST